MLMMLITTVIGALFVISLIPLTLGYWKAWQVLENRKYIVPITNNIAKGVEAFKKDIQRAGKEIIIFSDTAEDDLWAPVADTLREQKTKCPGLRIEVYAGYNPFKETRERGKNSTVDKLKSEGVLDVYFLKETPDYDVRLVDDKHFYMVVHGKEGDPEHNRASGCRSAAGGARSKDIARVREYVESWKKDNIAA
jgi:hypothetical protein